MNTLLKYGLICLVFVAATVAAQIKGESTPPPGCNDETTITNSTSTAVYLIPNGTDVGDFGLGSTTMLNPGHPISFSDCALKPNGNSVLNVNSSKGTPICSFTFAIDKTGTLNAITSSSDNCSVQSLRSLVVGS